MPLFSKLLSKGKVSFSQCGEDLIVDFVFKNLLKIEKPSFIDIGANDPIKFNNTFRLYKAGSRGINIDPNKQSIRVFNKKRKNDINIHCGIGSEKGVKMFYIFKNSMQNTFDEDVANVNGDVLLKEPVEIKLIKDVIDLYSNSQFPDFLSLDTEGMDLEILESIDFNHTFPKVVCVETVEKIDHNRYKKNHAIPKFLSSKNYVHHSDTYINSIFIHKAFLKINLE